MKAEVRETGALQREVEIHLEANEIKQFIDQMIDAYRRRYSFPGFRPGKVPVEVVMRKFQEDIQETIYRELVPRKIEEALLENKIQPAGPGKMSRLRYEPNEPMTFTVEVEVWPEVELKPYDDLEVEQLVDQVTDEDIAKQIEWIRERMATVNPVERAAAEGDILMAELETLGDDGQPTPGSEKEGVQIEVGGSGLLPEFAEAVKGAEAGEIKEIPVAYPADFSNRELAGEQRTYRMTINQVGVKELPELNDDFAKQIQASLDLKGLEGQIRLRLESEKRLASRERLEQQIVDRLSRDNPFDLPNSSVTAALDRLAQKHQEDGQEVDREELAKVYRPHIERAHRRELILAKVAEREGIDVTQQEVEAEIARMSKDENRKPEDVKKDLGDLRRLRDFLFERKVFEALTNRVKIREVMVPSPTADSKGQEGPKQKDEQEV